VLEGHALRAPDLEADALKWVKLGRALFFFVGGRLTSCGHESVWPREDTGLFRMPRGLAVPTSWSRSVSRELIARLVHDADDRPRSQWTVSDLECSDCSLPEEWIHRAFGDGGQSFVCMAPDAGLSCLTEALRRGQTGVSNARTMNGRFVDVSKEGFEVVFLLRRRADALICGGNELTAERCTSLAPIDGGVACVSPTSRRTLCREHRVVGLPQRLPLEGQRCEAEYLPVQRIDETGARFSCSEDVWLGVPLSQLSPRGHCERPAYGPLRCEGLLPDGGPAGQLRRAVFDRAYSP
jgi:hypothetical protein